MRYRINVAASILAANEQTRRSDPAIVVTAIDGDREEAIARCTSVDVGGPSRIVQLEGLRVYLETDGPIAMLNARPYRIE